jgi:hypothetical protein
MQALVSGELDGEVLLGAFSCEMVTLAIREMQASIALRAEGIELSEMELAYAKSAAIEELTAEGSDDFALLKIAGQLDDVPAWIAKFHKLQVSEKSNSVGAAISIIKDARRSKFPFHDPRITLPAIASHIMSGSDLCSINTTPAMLADIRKVASVGHPAAPKALQVSAAMLCSLTVALMEMYVKAAKRLIPETYAAYMPERTDTVVAAGYIIQPPIQRTQRPS